MTKKGNQEHNYAKNSLTRYLRNKQQKSAYGDGRPTCNRVLTSGSVGMGIPMGIWDGMGIEMPSPWQPCYNVATTGSRTSDTFQQLDTHSHRDTELI